MTRFLVFLLLFVSLATSAQNIGEWSDYLPYGKTKKIAISPTTVYAATPYSILAIDKENNGIERISKVNKLSDIGIGDIAYSETTNTLVVGYNNGNLDLIKGERTTNMQDILRTTQVTNKSINHVFVIDSLAYLSCDFGIALIDLDRVEVKETYFIGTSDNPIQVNQTTVLNDTLYSATNKGIYYCSVTNPLIKFPQAWVKLTNILNPNRFYEKIFTFNGKLFANYSADAFLGDTLYHISKSGSSIVESLLENENFGFRVTNNNELIISHAFNVAIYNSNLEIINNYYTYENPKAPSIQPRYAEFDENGVLWVADDKYGVLKAYDPFRSDVFLPSSPEFTGNRDIISVNNKTYVSRGNRQENWSKTFTEAGIFIYENNEWTTLSKGQITQLDSVQDIVHLAADPTDQNKWVAGSLADGIFEFEGSALTATYKGDNTSLQSLEGFGMGISDLQYDEDGNLWATNLLSTEQLHVKANGEWTPFNFSTQLGTTPPSVLMINSFDQKWLGLQGGGIFVFDENDTPNNLDDDQSILLTSSEGNGNLPSNNILALAEDKDGEVWIGTDLGLRVVYDPENVFEEGGVEADEILIKQGLYFQVLLETEAVTAIAIDGGDNKWIGTQTSGVFQLSPDGQTELNHFTESNSPLWSNNIQAIEINDITGEVFIGTDNGLISYRGTETEPFFDYTGVYAYPNPVTPDHNGPVAITGLVRNSEVRITDTAGNLLFKSFAPGGQVVWDLTDQRGNRVASGVYLVYVATFDGSQNGITKILISN